MAQQAFGVLTYAALAIGRILQAARIDNHAWK
jgi:hypothetical protein